MNIEYNLIFATMVSRLLIQEPHAISVIFHHQEEMERFPLSLVTDPTAVTNDDRRDVYNNVVLFTVVEDPHRRAPSEMHIFQSISNPVSLSSNYYYFSKLATVNKILYLFSHRRFRSAMKYVTFVKGVGAIKLDSKTLNQDPCIDQNALNSSGVNNID